MRGDGASGWSAPFFCAGTGSSGGACGCCRAGAGAGANAKINLWSSACCADGRSAGTMRSSSSQSCEAPASARSPKFKGRAVEVLRGCVNLSCAASLTPSPQPRAQGSPRSAKCLWTRSSSDVAGKSGWPRPRSSARTQPQAQTSTGLEYSRDLKAFSGARYQRVETYSVSFGFSRSTPNVSDRARPKSASLTWQSALMRRLEGRTSRWTKPAEWTNFKAFKSWYTTYLTCTGCSTPKRVTACRSVCM
mmetsp:Transcript_18563/g.66059  ORF Transcript_18563/g.66059 Transcript_18563/m.66059 type:complete len:248 (-) Transcript_18563:425-1168(-)